MTHPPHHDPFVSHLDDDDEATTVQASPFQLAGTMIGYAQPAVAPVRHTYTEPSRGYPAGAAYVPTHEPSTDDGYVIATFEAHPMHAHASAEPHGWHAPATPFEAPSHWTESAVVPRSAYAHAAYEPEPAYAQPAYEPEPAHAQPAYEPAPAYAPPVYVAQPAYAQPSFAQPVHAHVVPPTQPMPSFPEPMGPTAAPSVPAAPRPEASTSVATPSADEPRRGGRAIAGALLGALAGAALWGAIGFVTGGYELKYGALLIGVLTGGGASLLGRGTSRGFGVLGGAFGLVGILLGKALFELLVQPTLTMAEHIAYHTTPIDFIFYGATVVTGFAVGSGTLAPSTIVRQGRHVLRRFLPTLITG